MELTGKITLQGVTTYGFRIDSRAAYIGTNILSTVATKVEGGYIANVTVSGNYIKRQLLKPFSSVPVEEDSLFFSVYFWKQIIAHYSRHLRIFVSYIGICSKYDTACGGVFFQKQKYPRFSHAAKGSHFQKADFY